MRGRFEDLNRIIKGGPVRCVECSRQAASSTLAATTSVSAGDP